MQLTQKIRIYPSPQQEKVLWALSNQCRRLYNIALAERKDAYLKGEKITYQVQQNELILLKKQYPEFCIQVDLFGFSATRVSLWVNGLLKSMNQMRLNGVLHVVDCM